MKKKVDLSIIILNFNTKHFLDDCLKSLAKVRKGKYVIETIVIDNGSTDNSAQMVEKKYSAVKLIKSKTNLGFSAGNNLGIPKTTGKYVLFLNPDTLVPPDTLKTCLDFIVKDTKIGALTCRVELPDGSLDEACHRGFPTPLNALTHLSGLETLFPKSRYFSGYRLGYKPLNRTHQIDAAVGAFLLIRREAGDKVGWWDKDYFWYGEDLDFCYRLKNNGWKIFFLPTVKIIHYKGASSGIKKHSQNISTANKKTRLMAIRASTQAMRIFYKKHYSKKYPSVLTWLVLRGIDLVEKVRIIKNHIYENSH